MTAAFTLTRHEEKGTSQAFGRGSFILLLAAANYQSIYVPISTANITQVFMGLVAYC